MTTNESALTALLLAACLGLAATSMVPRWLDRPHTVRIEQPDIVASIEGAVLNPGVYTLAWGARVTDLVTAAGGLLPSASRALIALADPLTDGEVVQVPLKVDSAGEPRTSLNEARLAELERLPGIGPALARRIVGARPFPTIDDLLRVPGIGPAKLAALRTRVRP